MSRQAHARCISLQMILAYQTDEVVNWNISRLCWAAMRGDVATRARVLVSLKSAGGFFRSAFGSSALSDLFQTIDLTRCRISELDMLDGRDCTGALDASPHAAPAKILVSSTSPRPCGRDPGSGAGTLPRAWGLAIFRSREVLALHSAPPVAGSRCRSQPKAFGLLSKLLCLLAQYCKCWFPTPRLGRKRNTSCSSGHHKRVHPPAARIESYQHDQLNPFSAHTTPRNKGLWGYGRAHTCSRLFLGRRGLPLQP